MRNCESNSGPSQKRRCDQDGVCYWYPKHFLDVDFALCENLSELVWKKTSFMSGDFNCLRADWKTDSAVGEGLHILAFKQDNFLSQKMWEPTEDTNKLDLIFSTENDLGSEIGGG